MDKGAALRLRQVRDHHAGEFLIAAGQGRQDPPVAIDQVSGVINAGGHDSSKFVKAPHQLLDLFRRVQFRVVFVRDQVSDFPHF